MDDIKILIVEDDTDISNMLVDLLAQNGYAGVPAYSGTEALLVLERQRFSLILLDLMLPGRTGEQVLEELRAGKAPDTPVIAVSAIGETGRKVELLGMGADDYITKPFDNDELLARIQVQLRRGDKTAPEAGPVLTFGDLTLDTQGMVATVSGAPLSLTKRELLILRLLMESPKKVFTKGNIYESVWGEEFWGDENTVNVHISNIRQKLAKISPGGEYIQTVWGIGFKMSDAKNL